MEVLVDYDVSSDSSEFEIESSSHAESLESSQANTEDCVTYRSMKQQSSTSHPDQRNSDRSQYQDGDKHSDVPYFGLFPDGDSAYSTDDELIYVMDKSLVENQSKRRKYIKSDKNKDKSNETEQAEVPDGNFWKKSDGNIDWHDPDKIWMSHRTDSVVQLEKGFNKTWDGSVKFTSDHIGQCKPEKSDTNEKLKKTCFFLHHNIAPQLHQDSKRRTVSRVPKKQELDLPGHAGAVNCIRWCHANYSHLLMSVSMDRLVKVWNTMSKNNPQVQVLAHHTKAVKDAKWSHDGRQILSCGYDKTSRLLDVENGSCVQKFEEDQYVTCVCYHPVNYNMFISGSTNHITLWDSRKPGPPARLFKYKDVFGQVQDVVFLDDGRTFFTCNDLVSRDSADRNIMAWDFVKGVVISGQIYQERYTCSHLLVHPTEPHLLAQSQGNYIAQFSTIRPYKMNKCKRYEGHKVQGYSVGFDASPDGHTLVSGSSDGIVTFYDYHTSRKIGTVSLGRDQICMDVAWHPVVNGCIAMATWGGGITIWR